MATLRNIALIVLIGVSAFLVYVDQSVCHWSPSPAMIHRARLSALAGAIDTYVLEEGHLPATLDALAPPHEPGCIAPGERGLHDYRFDLDGVGVVYEIVDARSMKYRLAIPAHATRSGAWVPITRIEARAKPASTPP